MIFIPFMEMPKNCYECPFLFDEAEYCPIRGRNVDAREKAEQRDGACTLIDFDDSTIYGYKMKELIAFADACRKNGVDERDMKAFANNCEWALKVISDEQKKLFEEAWKKSFGEILHVEDMP